MAGAQHMKPVKLELTLEEITLLVSLASDQLFRREFIDPKIPGYRANPGEVSFGKSLVARLRLIIQENGRPASTSAASATGHAPGNSSKRSNGIPDAV
jgi:hypothetical protein